MPGVDINAIIASAMAGANASTSAGQSDPMVYWGQQSHVNTAVRDQEARDDQGYTTPAILKGHGVSTVQVTQDQAVSDFYSWSDSQRAAWGKRLYSLGVLKDPSDFQGMLSAWQDAVKQAANFYTFGKKKITPWDVVDILAGNAGAGSGPKTTTNTETAFSIPTLDEAKAAASSVTQALLGRDPDKNEQARLASILTSYARKNPTVTKSTATTDGNGNTSTTSTRSGGVSDAAATQLLKEQVQADPEYGSYQAATTYFNALMSAIGGTGA